MTTRLPAPYYVDELATLYHGDARELLPAIAAELEPFDSIVTDPVWPNAIAELAGSDDPAGLFRSAAEHFPAIAPRLVVHLGCNSDPRFLAGVPSALEFFRVCWLKYALPGYRGRLLYTSDVAYIYGKPPPWAPGRRVMPGETSTARPTKRTSGHPCPRSPDHVAWLLHWFGGSRVLDPFAGSGTTLLAAKRLGIPSVGIEIDDRYCRSVTTALESTPVPFALIN